MIDGVTLHFFAKLRNRWLVEGQGLSISFLKILPIIS